MSTTIQAPKTSPTANRVVMRDVPWETYLSLTEIDHRRTRIAYDEGVMEIMSPMKAHELAKHLIGRMVETWTEAKEIDILGVASTTFKADKFSKGFEADESYYIEHAAIVRPLEEVDLTVHPGPDLVIEVDITNSSMRKFSIYASLRVFEVWRWEEGRFRVYHQSDEQNELHGFVEVESSRVLAGFPFALAVKLIESSMDRGENELMREFRRSVSDVS